MFWNSHAEDFTRIGKIKNHVAASGGLLPVHALAGLNDAAHPGFIGGNFACANAMRFSARIMAEACRSADVQAQPLKIVGKPSARRKKHLLPATLDATVGFDQPSVKMF